MWALVDDNQKRFINELSDHLNEQSFSTVNSTLPSLFIKQRM
ncbi:hypothetical protein VCLMA_A2442 [Vibrio cholerae LMA3984-4]|nr:hypothetical protein VCLMA_A2442 [Vibrio cholerae LMA3984-4]